MTSETAVSSDEITVLVCFGERKRPVKPSSPSLEALKPAVLSKFADVLPSGKYGLVLQIKDDTWHGEFVDIAEGQSIPDRSVVKLVIETAQEDTWPEVQVIPKSAVAVSEAEEVTVRTKGASQQLQFAPTTSGLALSKPRLQVGKFMDKYTEENIRKQAVIYRKEGKRPLSNYQKQINKAAGDIAVQDPSILARMKSELLNAAKDEVYASGYNFKKGHSRAKRFSSGSTPNAPKRQNLSKDIRENRIGDIKEEIIDLNSRISFKEKRVTAAENMKNYKTCDELTGEISELKTKRRELEAELKLLEQKDKRAKHYQASHGRTQRTPVSPFSSDDERSRKSKGLVLESPSPTTSSSYDPSTCTANSSDGYQVDSCASRSGASSPSRAVQEAEFTADEEKKFSVRYQEGYNIPDERYEAWLAVNHPESVHQESAAASDLEMPEIIQPWSRTCTETLPSSSHSTSDLSLHGISDSQDQVSSPNSQSSQQPFHASLPVN